MARPRWEVRFARAALCLLRCVILASFLDWQIALVPTSTARDAHANAPVGVFDSGVGGLTVLRALTAALPHEDFLYLGDTARLPTAPRARSRSGAMRCRLPRCCVTVA